MTVLTRQQQKSLHKWFELKATQCKDAGVTAQMAFSKTIELEMSPQMMKEIFREVMKASKHKKSTTELSKTDGEIDDLIEHLNRFFAEKFNLEGIELPHEIISVEEITGSYNIPDSIPDKIKKVDIYSAPWRRT